MKRHTIEPRPDWVEKVEAWGMVYHTHEGKPYWDESTYYELDALDVVRLETATNDLHMLCLHAVERITSTGDYARFGLSQPIIEAIEDSWSGDGSHLYGRFDLAYDGVWAPKMLEYNADTPTALLEAAVIQWQWSQEVFPGVDQFNSIWEKLVARWKELKDAHLVDRTMHFAHSESVEDLMTVSLLRDAAHQAGIVTTGLHMADIGWSEERGVFVDLDEVEIRSIFKLYPWEWMFAESFGALSLRPNQRKRWVEPIWKCLLSNKAILPYLWEMAPGHPNLLPAFDTRPGDLASFVRKPKLSREGEGISVVIDGTMAQPSDTEEPETDVIYQALAPLYKTPTGVAVFGSWVVGDDACGIGIRECEGWVTTDLSRFVPQVIR